MAGVLQMPLHLQGHPFVKRNGLDSTSLTTDS